MRYEVVVALRMTVVTLVLTGLVYPLAVTGIAQAVFPYRADGSLLRRSLLIYGVGGVVAPFVGIKLIDLVLAAVGLA